MKPSSPSDSFAKPYPAGYGFRSEARFRFAVSSCKFAACSLRPGFNSRSLRDIPPFGGFSERAIVNGSPLAPKQMRKSLALAFASQPVEFWG
jgi:hypothetical protein